MARKYDVTRFIISTVVTGKTLNDDMEIVDAITYLDGKVSKDDAIKRATKEHGILKQVEVKYAAGMYGITSQHMVAYGEQLNPYTRQPWTEEENRFEILDRYIRENLTDK